MSPLIQILPYFLLCSCAICCSRYLGTGFPDLLAMVICFSWSFFITEVLFLGWLFTRFCIFFCSFLLVIHLSIDHIIIGACFRDKFLIAVENNPHCLLSKFLMFQQIKLLSINYDIVRYLPVSRIIIYFIILRVHGNYASCWIHVDESVDSSG